VRDLVLRPVVPGDLEHLQRAVYDAIAWNPDRELPAYEVVVAHPQVERYHRNWGRPGDIGVIAESAGAVAGVAFCRLFTLKTTARATWTSGLPRSPSPRSTEVRASEVGSSLSSRTRLVPRASSA
jgi:hypothetical protein